MGIHSFSLLLFYMGVMGSRPITSPTYIRLTMANNGNLKSTGALGDTSQGHASDHGSENSPNHPPVNSHVSFISFTCFFLTSTSPTSISSSIITTLEPYIPLKRKNTHNSPLTSSSSITQCPLLSLVHTHPLPLIIFLHLASLVLADRTNTSISLLMLHTQKTLQCQKCIQRQVGRITFLT